MNGGTEPILDGVVKKRGGLFHDEIFVGSDKADGSGVDGLGAFGFLAHDEDGFAEGGSFFLDSAGVGDEEMSLAHQVDEGDVVEGRQEGHVGKSGEFRFDDGFYVGVGVDREGDLDVRAILGSPNSCSHHRTISCVSSEAISSSVYSQASSHTPKAILSSRARCLRKI